MSAERLSHGPQASSPLWWSAFEFPWHPAASGASSGRPLIPRISTPGTCMSIPARSDWGDCQSARFGHSEEGNYYLPFASFFMAPKYQYRCRQCIITVLICTADRTDVAACCLRGKNKILVVIKYCHACRCRGATAWPNLIHSHVLIAYQIVLSSVHDRTFCWAGRVTSGPMDRQHSRYNQATSSI